MNEQTSTIRIFKIGTTRIVENANLRGKTNEEVQALLKPMYPQVANATIRTRTEGEHTLVEFLAMPGHKG